MDRVKKAARMTGLLYLLVVFSGLFGLEIAPARLMVPGNAAATAARILDSPSLYRIYMLNGLVGTLLFLGVALALYRLLRDVHPQFATLMVILVVVQTPLGIREVVNEIAALDALRGGSFWSAFDLPQRQAFAMSLLDLDNKGISAVAMLWGLWLLPLAVLVYRSGFLPRFLGVWLWLNGIAYMGLSVVGILWPQLYKTTRTIGLPAFLGELALTLWLLIVGARPKRVAGAVPAAV